MVDSLPVEVLLGIYLGILTGIIPALVAWTLGFLFKYFTGVSIPALAVVVLSLALAGVNGGLLALLDPTVRQAPNSILLTTAIIVVLMISLYAHSQGDKLGENFPKHITLRSLRDRTLSTDVIERVGNRGMVRVKVVGSVSDLEGYPALSPELREDIRTASWSFPADLPLSELETRFENKLKTEFDLSEVSARIDEQGHATVAAAPPSSGVSKRVPSGNRAVSINALVPTGLAQGDIMTVRTNERTYDGTVVSAQSTRLGIPSPQDPFAPDGGEKADDSDPPQPQLPTTTGGDGRITIALDGDEAEQLLTTDHAHLVVQSRGTRREFELLSLLRRSGKRLRKVTLAANGDITGKTIRDTTILDSFGVAILGIRREAGWMLAPRGSTTLTANDDLFVVGTQENLNRFIEVCT